MNNFRDIIMERLECMPGHMAGVADCLGYSQNLHLYTPRPRYSSCSNMLAVNKARSFKCLHQSAFLNYLKVFMDNHSFDNYQSRTFHNRISL